LDRYLRPEPRVGLAPIVRRYATSAIDVSDGLLGDLGHICETAGVGATIDAESVPLSDPARRILRNDPSALGTILNGGDDYEILATVAPANVAAFSRDGGAAGIPVTRIGTIAAGKGPPVVNGRDGRPIAIPGHSHSHF
jgi:thiamine-monophosphate kinase